MHPQASWQAGGCLAWVRASTAPSRHGYRRALPYLESQEGQTSTLSNLPSRSHNCYPLLYVLNTILVKALA